MNRVNYYNLDNINTTLKYIYNDFVEFEYINSLNE